MIRYSEIWKRHQKKYLKTMQFALFQKDTEENMQNRKIFIKFYHRPSL